MFIFKKIGCRAIQIAFRIALPILPYREPEIVSSCAGLGDIFAKERAGSVLVITDAGIVKNGLISSLEEVLEQNKIKYTIYDKTQPNPTVKNAEEALALYYQNNCDTLIAIGGGSAMDCAKAVGARVAYPKKSLNKMGGILRVLRRLPTLIAIPTTAGTGSEATLAAVIMPYVLEEYGSCVYKKLCRLGIAAGVCSEKDTYEDGAKKFIAAIRELNARMSIPDNIAGIRKEDVSEMAKHAEREANPLYPVPKLMTRKELEGLYYKVAEWGETEIDRAGYARFA